MPSIFRNKKPKQQLPRKAVAVSYATLALASIGLPGFADAPAAPQPPQVQVPAALPAAGLGNAASGDAAQATVWPPIPKAAAGAPNVVVVLIDDAGFGWSSVFGGPAQTPALDNLAAHGLRYNEFHVNSVCSPTRASLLSGRNDTQLGFGEVAEFAGPEPGYNSIWPKSVVPLAEVLRENGYSTAAFGKWHNTPLWEITPSGPFDRWPTSLGFEYFYGFMGAESNQFEPELWRDTTQVYAPKTSSQGYNLNEDLANDAIHWLRQHDASSPGKPFFLYYATGAIHDPHQVPKDWIAKYKGKFDQGWDKIREDIFARQKALGVVPKDAVLPPRPAEVRAWDSYSPDEKKLLEREAEVYAAYMSQTDYQIGRVLNELKQDGHTNDTIVLYIDGDNGAATAGGDYGTAHSGLGVFVKSIGVDKKDTAPELLKHLDQLGSDTELDDTAKGWGWAADTPFQYWKTVASHLGGVRDPLIVSWPGHIQQEGGIRSQFTHVTDIAPTIFELAGIHFPDTVDGVKQLPLAGTSFAFTFNDASAPTRHNVQYFEASGNRGIYDNGWWAGSRGGRPWELYNLTTDFTQANDVAAQYPDKLKELQGLYNSEAVKNQVYPSNIKDIAALFGNSTDHGTIDNPDPKTLIDLPRTQMSWTYRSGVTGVPDNVGPRVTGYDYKITANISLPNKSANGVIVAEGGRFGGFTLFVKDGHAVYEENSLGSQHTRIVSTDRLPEGPSEIQLIATIDPASKKSPIRHYLASYHDTLLINGTEEGQGDFKNSEGSDSFGTFTFVNGPIYETLDIGSDLISAVSTEYQSPNTFQGDIDKVTFAITDPPETVLTSSAQITSSGASSTPKQ